MNQIQEYDLVAIDRDIYATHKETNEPILLRKGQVGTVVMDFDGEGFLIDFADGKGNNLCNGNCTSTWIDSSAL